MPSASTTRRLLRLDFRESTYPIQAPMAGQGSYNRDGVWARDLFSSDCWVLGVAWRVRANATGQFGFGVAKAAQSASVSLWLIHRLTEAEHPTQPAGYENKRVRQHDWLTPSMGGL